MDQYSRRIIGFGVHAGTVDGAALCRMFNSAIRWQLEMPKYLSTDHDPLYRLQLWLANLRVLEVTEIKTVPYVPFSHPFVERLIGTLRRECLDRRYSGPPPTWRPSYSISNIVNQARYAGTATTHEVCSEEPPDEADLHGQRR